MGAIAVLSMRTRLSQPIATGRQSVSDFARLTLSCGFANLLTVSCARIPNGASRRPRGAKLKMPSPKFPAVTLRCTRVKEEIALRCPNQIFNL